MKPDFNFWISITIKKNFKPIFNIEIYKRNRLGYYSFSTTLHCVVRTTLRNMANPNAGTNEHDESKEELIGDVFIATSMDYDLRLKSSG